MIKAEGLVSTSLVLNLDFHAKVSYEKDIRQDWILETETISSFFNLSLLEASISDLDQYDEFIETENGGTHMVIGYKEL